MQTFSDRIINACRGATTCKGGEQRAQDSIMKKHHITPSPPVVSIFEVHLDVPHAELALVVRIVKGHERLDLSLRLLTRGTARGLEDLLVVTNILMRAGTLRS